MADEATKYFYCKDCKHLIITQDWLEENELISAVCDICERPAEEIPSQKKHIYEMVEAAKGKHTGPKTEEGKNKLAEAIVKNTSGKHTGPKTPEGKYRSSLNNWKHGQTSKQLHLLAPALAGKYPECTGCEYRVDCEKSYKFCPVNIEPVLRVARAYQEGDTEEIKHLAGLQQGQIFNITKMMIASVYKHGVLNPKVVSAKAKDEETEEIVMEWLANPLLKRIPEYMALMGTTADQQTMTPKSQKEQSNFEGFIENEKQKVGSYDEFKNNMMEAVKSLGSKMSAASKEREKDEALLLFDKDKRGNSDN